MLTAQILLTLAILPYWSLHLVLWSASSVHTELMNVKFCWSAKTVGSI